MGWEPWAIVLSGFLLIGAGIRAWAWWARERVVRALAGPDVQRMSRGITIRVMARGARLFEGMAPNRTHRTRGDLLLLADRFVLTSGRGKLLDVAEGRGPRLVSVRSPGPNKLVIEGSIPALEGRVGNFRIEAFLPDALDWVQALQSFVTPSEGDRPFSSLTP